MTEISRPNVVYAQLKKPKNMAYVYDLMGKTDQPMCSVVEAMIEFCKSRFFKMGERKLKTIKKKETAKQKRMKHYSVLAKTLK